MRRANGTDIGFHTRAFGDLITGVRSSGAMQVANAAILVITLAGWLLRVAPLVRPGGVLAAPVDYDEGVYSSAAALLAHGHVPYRDFVLVTPPGLTYFLEPFALAGGPESSFVAERVSMTILGALSIFLVGRLALRHIGPAAAVVAALVYATYPEAVAQDHGVFLEPLLNVLVLAAATAWISISDVQPVRRRDWHAFATGLLLGVAFAVKLWALFVAIACLAAPPVRARLSRALQLAGGMALSAAVLAVPMLAIAGRPFLHQVFYFQLARPPDGTTDRGTRLELTLFGDTGISNAIQSRHFAATVLALVGVAFVVGTRGRGRLERFTLCWFLVTITAFLLARPYYPMYNSFLAPSAALLAGVAAAGVVRLVHRVRPAPAFAAVATIALVIAPLTRLPRTIHEGEVRDFTMRTSASEIRRLVPAQACTVSFEPGRLLAADRLPTVGSGRKFAVDSYGALLLEQMDRSSAQYDGSAEAFRAQPLDTSLIKALRTCDFAIIAGFPGFRVLSPAQQRWLESSYRRIDGAPDLWKRQTRAD